MSSKKEKLTPHQFNDLFDEQIRQALNHFQNAKWLGKHSPLATPYFLGKALLEQRQDGRETAAAQGQTLQQILLQAAMQRLNGAIPKNRKDFLQIINIERMEQGAKGPAYHLLLLDLKYFRHYFTPNVYPQAKQEVDICEFLGVSRSSFFTHLKTARQRLGETLLAQIRPAMRLEQPPQPHSIILGQDRHQATAIGSLQQSQTLFIHGAGGCGKTTLGATIAQNWQSGPVFWYTFWPSLSEQLDTLLFAMGHFLNMHGASNLWGQLITNHGHIKHLNTAITLLRTDIAQLSELPLFCFDEMDYLLTNPDLRSLASEELITFLERMREFLPILLIGQQPNFLADEYISLSSLSLVESTALLNQVGLSLTVEEIEQLHQITNGNPRLLKICAPLLASGNSKLHQLSQSASINGLFSSLWQTMPPFERALAQQLAVFRRHTPVDAWESQKEGFQLLQNHAMLQMDSQGGVRLLSIFSELIRNDPQKLSADAFEKCHMNAAAIRIERGEFATAVYHLIQAGEPEQASQLWWIHRQSEISRGQGSQIYPLLQNIPRSRLSEKGKQALALSLAEISELLGKPEEGILQLEETIWPNEEMRTIDALTLKGKFLNALGQPNEALDTFNHTLNLLTQSAYKQVHLHTWRGYIQLQQRNIKSALTSARQAQYEAELFYGLVQEELGTFDEAFLAYQRALALASNLDHHEGIAKANQGLANLHARQGKVDKALKFAETAVAYFEKIGDPFNVEKVRNTIISIYFNQGRFQDVITIGENSLTYFSDANMPFWVSVVAATLSEAHLEVGNLLMAKKRAHQVLEFEEPQTMPYACYTLGLVAKKEQTFDDALSLFQRTCELAQQSEDQFILAYAERALGEIYIDQSKPQEAEPYLNRALAYFEQINNKNEILTTKKLLTLLK